MMRLLVSVRSAVEVGAAVDGGADIVDAKEPSLGSLGPVGSDELRRIAERVPAERPLSIALGDPIDTEALETAMAAVGQLRSRAGAAYVKVGLAAAADIERMLVAAVRMASQTALAPAVIAVAYADGPERCPTPADVSRLAARAGAAGVLLDTRLKGGVDLFHVLPIPMVRTWAEDARAAGLLVAVAGSLSLEGVRTAVALPVDIVGVRGAACQGGREGIVVRRKVARLRSAIQEKSAVAGYITH